jgi:hypothetical protein
LYHNIFKASDNVLNDLFLGNLVALLMSFILVLKKALKVAKILEIKP